MGKSVPLSPSQPIVLATWSFALIWLQQTLCFLLSLMKPGLALNGRQPTQASMLGNLALAWRYVLNESLKQKKNFFIGFTAVWLVVFSIVLLQNVVTLAPILFLIIGETSTGEMDILMNPGSRGSINFTDASLKLHGATNLVGVAPRWLTFSILSKTESYERNSSTIALVVDSQLETKIGLGRRWTLPPPRGRTCHVTSSLMRYLDMKSGDNVTLSIDVIELMAAAAGYGGNSTEFVRQTLRTLMGEGDEDGFGNGGNGGGSTTPSSTQPQIPNNPFLPPGLTPQVTRVLLSLLGIDVDGAIDGSVPIDMLALKRNFTIRESFLIDQPIDDPAGKFPSSLGNVVLLEMESVQGIVSEMIRQVRKGNLHAVFPDLLITPEAQAFINYLVILSGNPQQTVPPRPPTPDTPVTQLPPGNRPPLPPTTAPPSNWNTTWGNETWRNETLNSEREFLMTDYALLVVGMNAERYKRYSGSKLELDAAWLKWTNELSLTLGLDYGVAMSTPLGKMLGMLYYLRLVLDQMLLIVELFLIGLGCYLIYSLLLSDVESKVYESGMLRALGMQQNTLIALLSIQSLLFSIPGLSVGLFLAFCVWQPIRWSLMHFMATPVPVGLYPTPIIVGVVVGLFMPLAALIGPVQRSLSKTLRDSLDLYHSVANDTIVMVTKLEHLGLSPSQTWGAILMVIFGFIVYYLAPLSFIFLNLTLFFTIFVIVLAGMLIGLCLLAMLFHTRVQILVMHCIMWFSDARKLKPLVRKNLHGHGPRNSKTAVLFTTCIAFIIFAGSIFQLQTSNIVATIEVAVGSDLAVVTFTSNPANKLDEAGLTSYVEKLKSQPNSPIVAYGFSTFSLNDLNHLGYTRVGNLAEIPLRNTLIYGVSSNYMNAVFDKYGIVSSKDDKVTYKTTKTGKYDVIESLTSTPEVKDRYGASMKYPPELGTLQTDETIESELSNEFIYNHTIPAVISTALRGPLSVDTTTPITLVSFPIADKIGRHLGFNRVYTMAQPRAMVSKMPGFLFSSYKQTAGFAPLIVSMESYDFLRHLTYNYSYQSKSQIELEPEIPKRALFVRLKDSADEATREFIGNGLRNYVHNDLIQVMDSRKLVTAISAAIYILYIFSNIVAFLVMILCFFTLLVSFTSNINENSWEFGVLRAIGLSSFQVIRLYIYEASCIIASSVILGSAVGLLVAITLTLQADIFTELPFKMEFPVFLFCSLIIMSVTTAFLSSFIPARVLGAKKIASVLKGK